MKPEEITILLATVLPGIFVAIGSGNVWYGLAVIILSHHLSPWHPNHWKADK